jgi:hypothetical protein
MDVRAMPALAMASVVTVKLGTTTFDTPVAVTLRDELPLPASFWPCKVPKIFRKRWYWVSDRWYNRFITKFYG